MNKPVRLPHLVLACPGPAELRPELAGNPCRRRVDWQASGAIPRTSAALVSLVREPPVRRGRLSPLVGMNEHLAVAASSSVSFSPRSLEAEANAWLAGDRQQIPDRLPLLLAGTLRRQEIVRALGSYAPGDREILAGRVTGLLLTFIGDPDAVMRSEVIRALGNVVVVGAPSDVISHIAEVLTGPLVVPLLRDPTPSVRLAVVGALGQLVTSRFDAIAAAAARVLMSHEHLFLLHDQSSDLRCYLLKLLTESVAHCHLAVVFDLAVDFILEPESRLLLDDLEAPARVAMIKAIATVVIFGLPEQQKTASEYLVNAGWQSLLEFREGPDGHLLKEALDFIELYGEQVWSELAKRLLEAEAPISPRPYGAGGIG